MAALPQYWLDLMTSPAGMIGRHLPASQADIAALRQEILELKQLMISNKEDKVEFIKAVAKFIDTEICPELFTNREP